MTSKVSLTRQVKDLTAQAADLAAKLKQAESTRDYLSENARKYEAEVEQVHMLLDAMPNPPPRKAGDDSYKTFSTMTRLAAWLSHRS